MLAMVPGLPQLRRLAGAPVLLASAALLACAHPQAASAHAIQSTLETLGSLSRAYTGSSTGAGTDAAGTGAAGTSFALASSFSTGAPVADATVKLVPPGGTPIALGRTDARGQLNFQLPAGARSDWEIQVDGGPGHRDYLELPKGAVRPAATTFKVQPQDSTNPPNRLLTPLLGLGIVGALAGLWVVRTPHG
jgi:nickel transport protein